MLHHRLDKKMKIITTVILASCLAGTAHAQAPTASASMAAASAPAAPASANKMDAKRDMRIEQHIKDLHAKLKITAAEEAQWAPVAKAMRDSAGELDQVLDKREAMIGTASAVDDLNAYADIAQAHADAVRKLSSVFGPLYAAMPDDQKKLADEVFTQREHQAKNQAKNQEKKLSKLEK